MHRVFISHSNQDAEAAGRILAALEADGVPCWIAPRDIMAGEQWAGSIVRAIEESQAVLVVFCEASNGSPQVAREMELAVSNHKRLIPVRVADVRPTHDMQYFLGVSHWVDAFRGGLEANLAEVVRQVRGAIDESKPEPGPKPGPRPAPPRSRFRLPRWWWIPLVVLAAVAISKYWKPPEDEAPGFKQDPSAPIAPMVGRWKLDGDRDCLMEIQPLGYIRFAAACPAPFSDVSANINVAATPVWADKLYQVGDTGTFSLVGAGEAIHNRSGAFRVDGRTLIWRDADGERRWRRD